MCSGRARTAAITVGQRAHHPRLFYDIDWSTDRVLAQTLARAETLGLSVALLPPWYDVDTASDLERLRAEIETLPPGAVPHTRRFMDKGRRAKVDE